MPIDLSGLAALGPYAGWALAVIVMAGVVGLIVSGRLVPGRTHDRALRREDKQDERLDTFATGFKDLSKGQEFLVGFVQRRERADRDSSG